MGFQPEERRNMVKAGEPVTGDAEPLCDMYGEPAVPEQATLCAECSKLMDNLPARNSSRVHHRTCVSWITDVEKGCYICSCIRKHLEVDQYQWLCTKFEGVDDSAFLRLACFNSSKFHFLEVRFGASVAQAWKSYGEAIASSSPPLGFIRLNLIQACDFDHRAMRTPHASSTRAPEVWTVAKKWIANCVQNHKQCQVNDVAGGLPTRLLDLKDSTGNQIRLIVTAEERPEGHYVTLSYCWGLMPFLKLTAANEDSLKNNIELNDLPQTFREAIEVARRLDIRYIWIDALCIVQEGDGQQDWRRESVRMELYYANAYCNICASASTNVFGGLFRSRTESSLYSRKILAKKADDATKKQLYVFDDIDLIPGTAYTPLAKRAWAWQERLLARRNIHFCRDEIGFECGNLMATERFPFGSPGSSPYSTSFSVLNHRNLDPDSEDNQKIYRQSDPKRRAYEMWETIVVQYTKSSLTVPSDKPVAILSIANRFERILGDEYVLGLWRNDLEQQLLWFNADSGEQSGRRSLAVQGEQLYSMPSWSWLSFDGSISWSTQSNEISSTEWADETYFSVQQVDTGDKAVLSGVERSEVKLTLLCRIFQVVFHLNDTRVMELSVNEGGLWHYMTHRAPSWSMLAALDNDRPGFEMPGDKFETLVLPARTHVTAKNTAVPGVQNVQFLIVEPVDGRSGYYRRIGYMEWSTQDPHDIKLPGPDEATPYACVNYDPVTGKHEIWLM